MLSGGRDEHVEGWRGGWKRTSLRRGRDEHVEGWRGGWKRTSLRRSEKAREGAQAVDQAKNEINMHRLSFVSIFGDLLSPLLHPSFHPSLHPRSALAPPSQKKQRKACTFTLPERQNALVHPMLCNGTAAFESCLKRLVPMHIEKYVQKRK